MVFTASAPGALRGRGYRFAVVVFRGQPLSDTEQLAFAERFDGKLHTRTGAAVLRKNRFGNEALSDRRRMYGLGNRLWHSDASFEDPPGRYSMLHARVIPLVNADAQFADMRAAYDELDGATRPCIARVPSTIPHTGANCDA